MKDIVLALGPHHTRLLGSGIGRMLQEIVGLRYFGADKALFKIGVDLTCRRSCTRH